MFDRRIRPLIDPPLDWAARRIAAAGVGADLLTLVGLGVGLSAAVAIALGAPGLGLLLILGNRLLDGLDGAVARVRGATDFGGYLDIVADFAFYVSIPVAFGLADPRNLAFALLLVASFVLTGISFLAFAAIAARRGEETRAHGRKAFFYSTGLAEGGETIAAFVAMCLFPGAFPMIAALFAALCVLTVVQRSWLAANSFRRPR